MTITRASMPKTLKAGLDTIWGEYMEKPSVFSKFMNVKSTEDAYVEAIEINGFGFAGQKAESAPVEYEDFNQTFDFRSKIITYAKGFAISWEAIEDNKYMSPAERGTRGLARSLRSTKEQVCADILNEGFTTGVTYADGQVLFSTAHPSGVGSQANTFSVAKTFSEAAIEDYLILMHDAVDYKGLPIDMGVKCLVLPTALQFEAKRILDSTLQSGTANNDINAIYATGAIPEMCVNRYIDSSTAYYFATDVDDGLSMYQRSNPKFDEMPDTDAYVKRYVAIERYRPTVDDWRGAYGDTGA